MYEEVLVLSLLVNTCLGWRSLFRQVDGMWCLRKKLEQLLFPPKQEFSFSHFSVTIHMDLDVSAWVDRVRISHPGFTSSDGYQWTGNSSMALSYAVHHCVRHSAHAVSFTEMNVCPLLVFCECVNTSGVLFSFDSPMKIKQRRRRTCHGPRLPWQSSRSDRKSPTEKKKKHAIIFLL